MPQYRIPLVNLKPGDPAREAPYYEVEDAIKRVRLSGSYVSGVEVEGFESEWAAYCKAKYCVGLSSCSDALYLTLRYCKEELGYEDVATTPVSFWATVESAMRAGLMPIFRDIEDHGCVDFWAKDPRYCQLRVPVNLYGYPAPIPTPDPAVVVEDAAQSHGQPLRGWAACHSFYPTKNLGAMGQAGAVVTNDESLAKWLRRMRAHAQTQDRFVHDAVSGNWRMDEIQAAILRAKLPYLDGWNRRRREIAGLYRVCLVASRGIELLPDHPDHVYHIFGVRVLGAGRRSQLRAVLEAFGIETGVRYPVPLPAMMPAWAKHIDRTKNAYPNAERWCSEVLNLPIYPGLSDEQVDDVVKVIYKWSEALP